MKISHPRFPLALAAGLALPVAVFAHKALAPLFVLTAIAAIALHVLAGGKIAFARPRFAAALAALLALSAASVLWSLTPARSIEAAFPLAGLLFGFIGLSGLAHALDETDRARVRAALLIGLVAGLAFLLIESVFNRSVLRAGAALFGLHPNSEKWTLKPAVTIAVLLFWPGMIVLRKTPSPVPALLAVAAALIGAVVLVASDAAVLGLIAGGAVFFLARRWARITAPVLGAVVAGFMIAAPWIPSLFPDPRVSMQGIEYLPNSAVHRILIWQTTAKHIHERPWLGHGFDTARSLYPQQTTIVVPLAKPTSSGLNVLRGEPIPLHPHNMILQIWLELGAAGALALLAALLAAIAALARAPLENTERAMAYGFLVTALFIASVAYGAWQAWWLSALGLASVSLVAVLSRAAKAP